MNLNEIVVISARNVRMNEIANFVSAERASREFSLSRVAWSEAKMRPGFDLEMKNLPTATRAN